MTRPSRDPHSDLEDEGIPDLQEGYPEQGWTADPNQGPVPRDDPVAVDDTTPVSHRADESLGDRLRREEPEPSVEDEPPGLAAFSRDEDVARRAGRLVADSSDDRATGEDVGPDMGGFLPEERAMRVEDEGP
jgi:hypothetical protein